MKRSSRQATVAMLFVLVGAVATDCDGYGFWRYSGRADYADRYDLAGYMWPSSPGNDIYEFGNLGSFSVRPPGVDASWLSSAVVSAGNRWERWARIDFGEGLAPAQSGRVQLGYDAALAAPAETRPHLDPATGEIAYEEIVFGPSVSGGAWTQDLFTGVLTHELGHVLGLDDLYTSSAPYSEEFVDHPVEGTDLPDRRPIARQDNMMAGDVAGWYYDRTIIDNDEIAGVSWLWGGSHNQIVTGDLANVWNASAGRTTDPHHGDDPANGLGWWDYRGSIVSEGVEGDFPYVDVWFPGYERFVATAYPVAPWRQEDLGNMLHRFWIEEEDWVGNFDLWLQSDIVREGRVDAWVNGGREDVFTLRPDVAGLAWDGTRTFANVFGPSVPEPGSLALLAAALVALVASAKRVSGCRRA